VPAGIMPDLNRTSWMAILERLDTIKYTVTPAGK
jgi:hypothetical protein